MQFAPWQTIALALCYQFAATHAALPDAWRSRSIYQVLTDRFAGASGACDLHNYCGGTWAGLEQQLDYIQALGFDAVWISPVVDNWPGGYHGYWQRAMHSPNAHFGDWAALQSLTSSMHARGMYLMIDVVANHAYTDSDVSQNEPFNLPSHYHDCSGCPSGCSVEDYTDHRQMEHCRLAGLYDFDQTDPSGYVATQLLEWASFIVNASGADGLRVDTTPYVLPAFWQRFESSAGVYAVGEVDSGDISFAAPYQGAALSGILSCAWRSCPPPSCHHCAGACPFTPTPPALPPPRTLHSDPLFFVLRNVFQNRGSMRQLGDAWRAGQAAWKDLGLLGSFLDNHDNPRFMNAQSDVALYRGALAYSLLSDGIPIVYYGSEWLFHGANDPECREAFWASGGEYNAQAAPLGHFFSQLNAHRRLGALWDSLQVERWQDDSFYAFTKGNATLAAFTNVGGGGGTQTRDITYLPPAWAVGTRLCDALDCSSCVVVEAGPMLRVSVAGAQGVAVLSPLVAQC